MNRKSLISAIALITACLLSFGACSPSGGSSADTNPNTLNAILEAVHPIIKDYSKQGNENLTEDLFEDHKLPMYIVENKKTGDADYAAALDALGFDSTKVEGYLRIAAEINLRSDYMLVLYTTDMEATKAALDELHQGQVNTWSTYLPDQYEKVQNNVTGSQGNYLYYVTMDAEIQDEIVAAIKEALKG